MLYLRSFNHFILLCLALLGMSVSSVNAMLIGDTVNCSTSTVSWTCNPLSAVVSNPENEFNIVLAGAGITPMVLDIKDSSLEFDVLLGVGGIGGLGPLSIFNIDSVISGFSFDTDILGMDASRLSFTASSFLIDFDSLSIQAGQFLDIDLEFASPSPVPVPAAVWLFGTALIGFVGMSRRRKVA